jgi:ectoine hydroxylase-related dioxygenase (phytanoyl-CoA dioxygenase family)
MNDTCVILNELPKHLQEDGYAVLPGRLSAVEVSQVNDRFAQYAIRSGDQAMQTDGHGFRNVPIPGVPGASLQFEPGFDPAKHDAAARELGVRKFFQFAQGDQSFWDLARDRRLLDPVEAVIGAGAQLLQSLALVKPPEIGIPKAWHQDTPYFPITPVDQTVGIWIALDRATLENGCMQVVPGSHRQGPVPHVQGATGWCLDAEASARAQAQAVAVPVGPGDALLFDANLLHFTDANRSRHRRRALQLHYSSAATRASGSLRLESLDSCVAPWRQP